MPRSLKKGPFVDQHLLHKVDALNDKKSADYRRACEAESVNMVRRSNAACSTSSRST